MPDTLDPLHRHPTPGRGFPALPPGEDAHQLFVDSVRDYAIVLLDGEGYVRSWNTGAARINGYTADEIIGQHFSRFYPDEDVQAGRCARILEVARREGRFEDLGWRIKKDGARFFANVVITPVVGPKGEPLGFSKVTRDLTERLGAEATLRQSEDRFTRLVEGVADYAIFMLDPNGVVLSWNAGAQRIKGYTAGEIVGSHFSRFYTREDVIAGKCEQELAGALKDGRFEDEGWRLKKDGTRFWANVVLTPVRGADGRLLGFSKVTRDLTERRASEEVLRQSEERFRLLVDGVSDYAIFMLDPQGIVKSWNAGAQRIKGYAPDEIVGAHFSRFYPPEDVAAGKCERELDGALREGRHEDEGWRLRKDGTRFWANVVLTSVRNDDGTHVGFAKVTRDLTLRKQAEETRLALVEEQALRRDAEARARERAELVGKLEESNRKLEDAVRARDDFLTVVSHELKTPLHVLGLQVSTSAFLMDSGTAPLEKVKSRLHKAQGEVQRLNRLITNLLDISRITANRLYLEPLDHDLVAITREVLERDREEIARAGCAVSLAAPDALPGHWDPLRLDQVLTNLLSNALKYGDKKPVAITLARVDERARIVVQDEGIGIDEQDLGRIFERFERAVSPRSHSGFGLGLWIVRQILDAMGGTIRVESQKGRGSTFTVEFPLWTEAIGPV